MKNKLEKLIRENSAMDDAKKNIYLKAIDYLPKDKLKELFEILSKEAEEKKRIKSEGEKRESDINKWYLHEMDTVFKTEQKRAIGEEETAEKQNVESILNSLDNT